VKTLLVVSGHIARLTQGTPSHNALHCQAGRAYSRSLGGDWRRRPANLWRQTGHSTGPRWNNATARTGYVMTTTTVIVTLYIGNDNECGFVHHDVFCLQCAIQTVTVDASCKVMAIVTHPVRLCTCLTPKPNNNNNSLIYIALYAEIRRRVMVCS